MIVRDHASRSAVITTALIEAISSGVRRAADWHVPLALIAAAACLVAAVSLPILVVR